MELRCLADWLVKLVVVIELQSWGSYHVTAHSAHHHYGEEEKPTGFHDDKVVQDKEHIGEHLDGVANLNVSDMSPGELEFHYFKLHDFDNNSMLDGLEIYKALTHLLPYEELDDKPMVETAGKSPDQILRDQKDAESYYYAEIVDTVLEEDDMNNDGYLTYTEYLIARHREEYQRQKHAKKGPR